MVCFLLLQLNLLVFLVINKVSLQIQKTKWQNLHRMNCTECKQLHCTNMQNIQCNAISVIFSDHFAFFLTFAV